MTSLRFAFEGMHAMASTRVRKAKGADFIRVVSFVHNRHAEGTRLCQDGDRLGAIVDLARREDHRTWNAQPIDRKLELRIEASFGAPQGL